MNADQLNASIAKLMEDAKRLDELRKKHCEWSKACQAKKRAKELGISVEEYLQNKPKRGRPRKQVVVAVA